MEGLVSVQVVGGGIGGVGVVFREEINCAILISSLNSRLRTRARKGKECVFKVLDIS